MRGKLALLVISVFLLGSMTIVSAQEANSENTEMKGQTISQTILGAINGILQKDRDPNSSPIESGNADKSNSDSSMNTEGQVNSPPEAKDEASERSARKGRNPQTGKEIKIPAKKVVKFKPGAALSEKIKTSSEDVCSGHGECKALDTENLYMVELGDKEYEKEALIESTSRIVDEDNDGVAGYYVTRRRGGDEAAREGNDAKHEKKLWGQVSFDDLEMARGFSPEEAGYELGEEFSISVGDKKKTGYSVKVRPIAGSQNRVLVEPLGAIKEYSPPELEASVAGEGDKKDIEARTNHIKQARDNGNSNETVNVSSRTEWEDLTMSRGAKQGEKMVNDGSSDETGKKKKVAIAGDSSSDVLIKNENRVALALNSCGQECADRLAKVAAEYSDREEVPVKDVGGDSAMGQEEITIAYDRYKRTK